jgi:hypothetical protein
VRSQQPDHLIGQHADPGGIDQHSRRQRLHPIPPRHDILHGHHSNYVRNMPQRSGSRCDDEHKRQRALLAGGMPVLEMETLDERVE